jgi:hypothetical protein
MKKKLAAERYEGGEITVHFAGSTYEGNFIKDLRIRDTHINDMLTDQPARFAFWANLSALQQYVYEKKKMELEVFEAKLWGLVRARIEREPGGRVTDRTVELEVKRHPQRIEKYEDLLKAKYQSDRLNAIKFAFIQRKDMLMSLGANLREEMGETSIRIKEKRFAEDRLVKTAEQKIKKGSE